MPEANPEDSNWLGAGKVIGIGATNSARLIHVASDLGGLGAPANAVVFLASDNGSRIAGQDRDTLARGQLGGELGGRS